MDEFFANEHYNNTIVDWTTSLLIFLGAYIFSKLAYWIFGNILKRITAKTKTRIDDILVDLLEKPIIFGLTVFGLWYGIHRLRFPDNVDGWIDKAYFVIIALTLTWLLSRIIDAIIKEYLIPRKEKSENNADSHMIKLVQKGLRTVIWSLGIVVALNNAGYNVGALLAGLGIGGLALAMAAKDTVANIFGGITIFTDKPFKIKDRIIINGYDGIVEEIGIRSTKLRTLAGRIVTIPNMKFTEGMVENVAVEPSRKITLNLGLEYSTSTDKIEKAIDLLTKISSQNKSVEKEIETSFANFGDFSLAIIFIYYIKSGENIPNTQTAINLEIKRKFEENMIEMAFPAKTVLSKTHLKN